MKKNAALCGLGVLISCLIQQCSISQTQPEVSERLEPPLRAAALPQAQPEPSSLSRNLAGGRVAVMS